jgi:hypothetical protein
MKLSEQVEPIGYPRADAPEKISALAELQRPVVTTLYGESKAIPQDVTSYEESQETLALLKVLALTGKGVADGKVEPAASAFAGIRARWKA